MMKYGITLFGNRVSPRYSSADSVMLVSQIGNKLGTSKRMPINISNLNELSDFLIQNQIDILVCGGITEESKKYLYGQSLSVIDNVSGTAKNIIEALKSDRLRPGYGFIEKDSESEMRYDHDQDNNRISSNYTIPDSKNYRLTESFDCLKCTDRICLKGERCEKLIDSTDCQLEPDREMCQMLEAATDIACEKERTLCRLSELIYFCLEMQYERLGVAYCVDLEEPAEILVRLLRRFFTVYPVCCRVGGIRKSSAIGVDKSVRKKKKDGNRDNCCNPWGQAQILNNLETDFNVMVGLCMGADCVFIKGSLAPTTGLFIKDKSLANNPIGAIYSEYYLREAVQSHR